jgi:hypothetical protein
MEYAGSNLAREINRLTKWRGPVFDRRYTMIPVSNEEAAQVEVLKYVLAHGCVSYCTSFQDLVVEVPVERPEGFRSGQSAGTS